MLVFQKRSSKRLTHEEIQVIAHAITNDIPFRYLSIKRVNTLRYDEVPIGSINFIHSCLKTNGYPIPKIDHYPKELTPWMYREIKQTNLQTLLRSLKDGEKYFVKPAAKLKYFTGTIIDNTYNKSFRGTILYTQPLQFLTEWRVYVSRGKILGTAYYYIGDESIEPPMDDIKAMVNSMPKNNTYTLDVAVCKENHKTALVEVNGNYSIGMYDIDVKDYLTFLISGWNELSNKQIK
jgi:hypothetical protein